MNDEVNTPVDTTDGEEQPTGVSSSPSAANSAPEAEPKPKRRRRVVSQPQSLNVTTELTGSFNSLPRPQSVEQAEVNSTTAARYQPSPPQAADPLAGLQAKEDELSGWGEKTEDLSERLNREKPPHWG